MRRSTSDLLVANDSSNPIWDPILSCIFEEFFFLVHCLQYNPEALPTYIS